MVQPPADARFSATYLLEARPLPGQRAWHRWTTLVITAHAFLAAATTVSTTRTEGLIAITTNELRRLFHALIIEPARRIADVIAWSIFRRRHQATAITSHYARQALTEP